MRNNWKVRIVLVLFLVAGVIGIKYHVSSAQNEVQLQSILAENSQSKISGQVLPATKPVLEDEENGNTEAKNEVTINIEDIVRPGDVWQDEIIKPEEKEGDEKIAFEYQSQLDSLKFSVDVTDEVTIDWGDGKVEEVTSGDVSHKYAVAGSYKVEIKEDEVSFLDLSGVKGIKNLLINEAVKLEYLEVDNTDIKELTLKGCENLKYLVCNNTSIKELNLIGSPKLEYLYYGEGIELIRLNVECKTLLKLSGSSKTVIEYNTKKESIVKLKIEDMELEFEDGSKERILAGNVGEEIIIPDIYRTNEDAFALYILDGNGEIIERLEEKPAVAYKKDGILEEAEYLVFEEEPYELSVILTTDFKLPEVLKGKENNKAAFYRDNEFYPGGSELSLDESYLSVDAYIISDGEYQKYYMNDEITYTLKYDANGGIGAPEAQVKNAGEHVVLAGNLTREGFIFKGWATAQDAKIVEYHEGQTLILTKDITLYAVWSEEVIEEVLEPVKIREFRDVKEDAWYYNIVTQSNYLEGTTKITFSPDDPLTREMFISALYNIAGLPAVNSENIFFDIPGESWSEKAITWATTNNLVSGFPDGRFKPSENITRQEAIVVLKKYAEYNGYSTEKRADLSGFNDSNKKVGDNNIYDWAEAAMSWAVAEGIISGNNHNNLSAREDLTRAETVAIFNNLLKAIK